MSAPDVLPSSTSWFVDRTASDEDGCAEADCVLAADRWRTPVQEQLSSSQTPLRWNSVAAVARSMEPMEPSEGSMPNSSLHLRLEFAM